jgi:hypothetical protein
MKADGGMLRRVVAALLIAAALIATCAEVLGA